MKMQMTDSEILASYRQAKDKAAQVKILAELNACPVQTIKDILVAQGVDWRQLPRVRGKGTEEKKPAETTEKATENGQSGRLRPDAMSLPTSNEEPTSTSDKESTPTREDRTIATTEEEIILLALYALRQRTEDQMAYAESEYAAKMKRYNSLLSQVEEILKKRETDEILKNREPTTKTV